jgi:uncharacterized repeat protein (TIGR03803 family)
VASFSLTQAAGSSFELQTLHEFESSPKNPRGVLVEGSDGNWYGTSVFGGTNSSNGTVFQMTPAGLLKVLHSFQGSDGAMPFAGLVEGRDGLFYGTAERGAPNSEFGAVFQIRTNGEFTILHYFNGLDGSYPRAALVQGNDGNFYGTTADGGTDRGTNSNNGTVFKITPGGLFTNLFSFNGTNGSRPTAGLVQGSDGSFYGTTSQGGPDYNGPTIVGKGTVFRITATGLFRSLHAFDGTDGAAPEAGLVEGSDGQLYGTTQFGGTNGDNGTVFRITTNGALTSMHSFDGSDGNYPVAGLTRGSDGNFYGATAGDNSTNFGTIFRITQAGTLTTLSVFKGTNGASPVAGLTQGLDGNFYSNTFEGGAGGDGTLFRLVEPVVIAAVPASNGRVTLTWNSFTNGTYRIEQNPDLAGPDWMALGSDVVATHNTTSITNNIAGAAQRFYRVRLVP